jgi:hypothetical protein
MIMICIIVGFDLSSMVCKSIPDAVLCKVLFLSEAISVRDGCTYVKIFNDVFQV